MPGKPFETELIRGWRHEPATKWKEAIAITHGAGGNCEAPLLIALAESFAEAGWMALRYDLPFRIQGKGAPSPARAVRDREGIRQAAASLRELGAARVSLCGTSYGGRQSSMLAAEDSTVAEALLLLSYPLHPPGKPDNLRTAHFPSLPAPVLFVHGTRDPFGTIDEMRAALPGIPAHYELEVVEGAPHGLPAKMAASIANRFIGFVAR